MFKFLRKMLFDETDVVRRQIEKEQAIIKGNKPKEEFKKKLKFANALHTFDPDPKASEVPEPLKWFSPRGKVETKKEVKEPKETKTNFICQAKSFEIECNGIKCIAHIVTRQFQFLKTDKNNQLIICKAHETFFNKKGNKFWWIWVRENYPSKYSWVKQHREKAEDQLRKAQHALEEYQEFLNLDK